MPTTCRFLLTANAWADRSPAKVPRSRMPLPCDHKKACTSSPLPEEPTTSLLSFSAKACDSLAPGTLPKSAPCNFGFHRIAFMPPDPDDDPAIQPVLLTAKAALALSPAS